jgi:hypothetical protein
VSTETENIGGIRHQATTGEDTADWEGFAQAVVICKVYKSVTLLKLFVVTSFKSSINPITSSNPVSSHYIRTMCWSSV